MVALIFCIHSDIIFLSHLVKYQNVLTLDYEQKVLANMAGFVIVNVHAP